MDLKPTFERYFPEGVKGGQCAAFAEKLVKFGPVGNSYASKLAYVKKYGSTVVSDIQVGDVVLTDNSKVNGHIFVVNCDLGDKWQVTESNFNSDERVHHTRLVAKNSPRLKGHIRAPLLIAIINQNKSMNILMLKSKIPSEARFQATVDFALNWFNQTTGGQLVPKLDYAVTAKQFTSVAGNNTQGAAIYFVNPDEVVQVANPLQNAAGGKYQIVTLCADYDEISPRPTWDEAFFRTDNGFTQSHLGLLKTDQDQFIPTKAAYLVHEWLHNFYWILNQKGINLVDDVHNHSTDLSEPRPEANFSDIVNNKLKPYWSILNGQAQGENMIIIHKKSDVNTKFYINSEGKNGFADFPAFQKQTAGKVVIDIALDDAEFDRIPSGANFKS